MTAESVHFYDRKGNELEKIPEHIDWELSAAEKNGYDHFMLKEIYEQPKALAQYHFAPDSGWENRAG